MKKRVKRLFICFLVLLNFPIFTYASEMSGNYYMRYGAQIQSGGSTLIMPSKTFGDSNGFRWIYDTTNGNLTVTGEDKGIDKLPTCLPIDIRSNTKKIIFRDCVVTGGSMSYMFAGFRDSLSSVDLSGLDTSKVTDMSNMFYWCSNLTSVDMSDLDTSSVEDMSDMFSWCKNLTSVDMGGLDTSSVEDMSYMFASCERLVSVDMSGLDTSKVKDMSYMFSGCGRLASVDMNALDTSKATYVADVSKVFAELKQRLTGKDDTPDTSKITNMSKIVVGFREGSNSVDLSDLDTSKVRDMSHLFSDCDSLTSINMSGLDLSKVKDMSHLFSGCERLSRVDISGLDISDVADMSYLLSGCNSLECIATPEVMAEEAVIELPTSLKDCQGNMMSEITSEYCDEVWAKEHDTKEYSIIYDLNGGKNNSDNPDSYTKHTKTIVLQKPTRKGYTFKGWYSDEKFTQKITKIKMGSTGELTLYAKWKIKTYDITYKLGGGKNNSENPSSYKVTTDTFKFRNPTRKGYIFKGWYDEDNEKILGIKKGSTGNRTLYARWKAKEYDISYKLDGGKNAFENPSSYKITTATFKLQNPTKTGYTFKGWYNDKDRTKMVTEIPKGSTGDKVFYAKWSISKYDIAYDGNGSTSGSMTGQSDCSYGSSYTLNTNVFARTGYTFTGWNTKADGSGITYADKARVSNLTITDGGTVTMYAQWEPIKYSVTYHLNGGVNSNENPAEYTVTTETITLKNPTRPEYTFDGWYNNAELTEKVTEIEKGSTGDKVFYSKWKGNKYNIAFNGNGSTSGSMTTQSGCIYGNSYILNSNVFVRTGYTFAGWNTKADGSGTAYADKASVSNLTSIDGSTVTLYAQWKPVNYSITYYLNGGVNSNENPTSYSSATATITLKNPTRTGYIFEGWYSNYSFTERVTTINGGSMGNKVLYAKWSIETYDITYKLNGGKNNSANPTSYTVITSTIKLQNPTREGYTFKGWYSNKKCTKKVSEIKLGSAGDKTFYAKWVKK